MSTVTITASTWDAARRLYCDWFPSLISKLLMNIFVCGASCLSTCTIATYKQWFHEVEGFQHLIL